MAVDRYREICARHRWNVPPDFNIGAAVCREHAISENTFYRWRKTYGGMSVNEAQRLKELEKENARLKRLLAERVLENDLLKELLGKKG